MRKFVDRNFLGRSSLLLSYLILCIFLSKLFSYLTLSSSILRYYKYHQLLVTYIPLSFFIFSLVTLIIGKKSLIIFDFAFYLLNIPIIFVITSWESMGDPFVVLRFFYLLNLYIKIIPFLVFLYKMLEDKKDVLTNRRLIISSFLISLVFFSSLAFLDFSCRKLSGDEPHYLLVTHSLLHDFDFDLLNNYIEQDYLPFYPDFLASRNVRSYGGWKILSQLGIGFPIVLLPGYAVLGRLGAQLIICIITSLIIVNLLYILHHLNSKKGSIMIFLFSFLSSPFLIYSRAIYPEMFIALVITFMMRLILAKPKADRWFIAAMTFLSLLLIATKLKNFFPVLMILLISFKKYIPQKSKFYKILAIMLLFAIYLPLLDYYIFGKIFYPKFSGYIYSLFTKPPVGLLGLLFDQESGIVIAAPIFLLAIVEIIIILMSWKAQSSSWKYIAFFLVSNYCFIGIWQLWHGLSTPAPRYIIPIIPLIILFYVKSWKIHSGYLFHNLNFLFMVLTVIYGFLINLVSEYWYNWCDGSNTLYENMGKFLDFNICGLLPSFFRESPFFIWQMSWFAVFLVMVTCLVRKKRNIVGEYRLHAKGKILLLSGLAIISLGIIALFIFIGKILPTHIIEPEDKSAQITGTFERYPLQIDPWYGARYVESRFDNGVIIYPTDKLNVRVNLKSRDCVIYFYLFREKDLGGRSVLLLSFDDKEEKEIVVNNGSWCDYIRVEPKEPYKFSELCIENFTYVSSEECPEDYGIVIDKIVFEYL